MTSKLIAETVAVGTVSAATRDAAFALFQEAYSGADRARFERDLNEKQLVILLRDRASGALKGFSTVLIHDLPGTTGTVIYSGDTVVDRAYWGQKQLQSAFARILLSHKARAPRRALYWFLLSKGYRTYLLLANAFERAVPRHDRAEDAHLRAALNRLATARFGAQYDAAAGIVRYETPHEHVRAGLAPITTQHLENPHVRFFAERNPGHQHGDELACLAEVRWRDLVGIAMRLCVAALRRRQASRADTPGRVRSWTTRPAECL